MSTGKFSDPNQPRDAGVDAARMSGAKLAGAPRAWHRLGPTLPYVAWLADSEARGDQIMWLHAGREPAMAPSFSSVISALQVCPP